MTHTKTEAQKITELICKRRANKMRVSLPEKFWNIPEWKNIYKQQIIAANSLLKIYSYNTIVEAINKNPKIYSLRFPRLHEICEEVDYEMKKTKIQDKQQLDFYEGDTTKKQFNKKTTFSKLD